jgi:hypothetical protein
MFPLSTTTYGEAPGRTYYDTGEADESQHKSHVRFCGCETTPGFECVDRLAGAQDPSEEQALSRMSKRRLFFFRND